MPLTQIKRVCARECERLFKGNISSQYTNSCCFFFLASLVCTLSIPHRSTSLSYYLIIMFSIRFSCRAACANIVVDQLFQGGYRRRPIELYILTASRSDVDQRVAKAFDVAKHYLPVNTRTADCTYPPYHTLCHFARIQNTTHIHAIQRSSVPLFNITVNCLPPPTVKFSEKALK